MQQRRKTRFNRDNKLSTRPTNKALLRDLNTRRTSRQNEFKRKETAGRGRDGARPAAAAPAAAAADSDKPVDAVKKASAPGAEKVARPAAQAAPKKKVKPQTLAKTSHFNFFTENPNAFEDEVNKLNQNPDSDESESD